MTLTALNPMARLALSGAVVFAVLAAVAGASSALLITDPVIANNITLATGTADLQIAPDNGTVGVINEGLGDVFGDAIAANAFEADNLIPGGAGVDFPFFLKNTSSSGEVDLSVLADLSNFGITEPTDLDSELMVSFACTGMAPNATAGITSEKNLTPAPTGWGNADTAGGEMISTLVLGQNEVASCTMTAELGVDSTASGETATFDATFTGEQVAPPV